MTGIRLRVAVAVMVCLSIALPATVKAATYDAWTPANDGLWGAWVTALAQTDAGVLYAGTLDEGVFVYTPAGGWQAACIGLPAVTSGTRETFSTINVLRVWPALHAVVAGTSNGAYIWLGDRWSQLGIGLDATSVWSLLSMPGSNGALLAGTDNGVWSLAPAGSSWVARNAIMRGVQITAFLPAPDSSGTVWCSGRAGLFRSDNSGADWLLVSPAVVSAAALMYYPFRAGTMFAAGPAGIQRSFDGGMTWTLITARLGNPPMYAILSDDFDSALVRAAGPGGIIESTDAGETWHWTWSSVPGIPVTACILDSAKSTAPVLVGTRLAVGSVNGGQFVQLPSTGLGILETGAATIHPIQKTAYVVRRSGLYRAVWGGPWQLVNSTLGNAGVRALATDTTQPRTLYSATSLGIRRSSDDGVTWSDVHPAPPGNVMDITCGSGESGVLYAATDNGLYRLDRVGAGQWRDVGPLSTAYTAVAAAPHDASTVFAVTGMSIYRTTDSSASWQRWGVLDASWDLHVLSVDPQDSSRLYAATSNGLWVSQNGGAWTRWGSSPSVSMGGFAIAASGAQVMTLVTTQGGVLVRQEADDSVAPTIEVLSPKDGSTVSTASIEVVARVADAQSGVAQVTVNGTVVMHESSDGLLHGTVVLVKGTNAIAIEAVDRVGNRSTRSSAVIFSSPSTVLTLQIGSTRLQSNLGPDVVLDAAPVILRSRTFLPIRAVAEALGGTVGWDAATRTATVRLGIHQVSLQIGSNVAIVDGVRRPIDSTDALVVPVILSGRTLLPVRFVAESLGCQVDWDAATRTVTVTYNP